MPVTQPTILDRLTAAAKPGETWDVLVLAALESKETLEAALSSSSEAVAPKPEPPTPPDAPQPKQPPKPLGAYLKSIAVEGFRGIGPKAALDLPPGPGLTLVVGRNGSGKSSFAEALELLLTGDTFRWAQRTKVWREGWRNLHHKQARVQADFALEGERGSCAVWREWPDDTDDVAAATAHVQIHGKPRTGPEALGWDAALATYRPFLSYNELGSMLDEGPSKLYDALSAILGLDDLVGAQEILKDARTSREKAQKEAGELRKQIVEALGTFDDDRARAVATALNKKDWGLDEAEAILAQAGQESAGESLLATLRQLANIVMPDPAAAKKIAQALRDADNRMKETAGTVAARSEDLVTILDHALRFHDAHGDGDCPVCGRPKGLDAKWHKQKASQIEQLRHEAQEATTARKALEAAVQQARALPAPEAPKAPKDLGLDLSPAVQATQAWRAGLIQTDPQALATHLEASIDPLTQALTAVRDQARTELQRREDQWTPLARQLNAWLPTARTARKAAEVVPQIKQAEKWLKETAEEIRNERFAPIAERAIAIWEQLRIQSNVSLGRVYLGGSGTKRHVELDVAVDGVEGTALGVMSQGELHSLALSLFVPRATLPESPFRFIVIDDPVQSMDPSRVDGLARVLAAAAHDRQVVVFTHDDRLPEAVRRLDIRATVIEVTRRENSLVQLRLSKDPVSRYIEDAIALAYTADLPAPAARRVIPGLCRLAIEAACMDAVRRRRIGRGERHADVEQLLESAGKTTTLVALAMFDDPERGKDVLPHINKDAREAADTFRWCNEGTHKEQEGPMIDHIRRTEKLAGWLRGHP